MAIKPQNIAHVLSLNMKELDADSLSAITDEAISDAQEMLDFGITKFSVTAQFNPTQNSKRYMVKIVASVPGKTFVEENYCKGSLAERENIVTLYKGASNGIYRQVREHKDHQVDKKRRVERNHKDSTRYQG